MEACHQFFRVSKNEVRTLPGFKCWEGAVYQEASVLIRKDDLELSFRVFSKIFT